MRFPSKFTWPLFLLAILAISAPISCSQRDAHQPAASGGPTGQGVSVRFEQPGTITLAPGESREVTAVISPAGRYRIRFSLLGETSDASLARTVAQTDDNGAAKVLLHAPKQPTTFRIRASILDDQDQPGPTAETGVAVSAQGFGAVRVLPQYAGKRAIQGWTASVVADTTCAAIAPLLPGEPDGALVESTTENKPILVTGAPVGPSLAVAIRSRRTLWGCADATGLKPDTTLDVKVTIFDKPIDLSATNLDLTLEFNPEPVAYSELIGTAISLMSEAFAPSGAQESTLVLDGMGKAAPDAGAFAAQRAAAGWDAQAEQYFSALGLPLHDQITSWAAEGLLLADHQIRARLKAKPDAPGSSILSVVQFDGTPADAAGIPPASPFSWSADPNDTLLLSGIVLFRPRMFIGAWALAGARQKSPGVADMPAALALAASCPGLATTLGGYASCDANCLEALCRASLAARWATAIDMSQGTAVLGYLSITAAGPATLSEEAEPVGLQGNWIGSVSDGTSKASVKGKIEGQTPPVAPPP